jgi:hypothetical protein
MYQLGGQAAFYTRAEPVPGNEMYGRKRERRRKRQREADKR